MLYKDLNHLEKIYKNLVCDDGMRAIIEIEIEQYKNDKDGDNNILIDAKDLRNSEREKSN